MDEPDIVKLMQWEHTNICSDGSLDGAHPRGFGAFTRVLGRYVREQQAMTLESAIHRMTALSAAHVGISRRGTIAPGMFADLVLFDPATVLDNATPQAPHEVSTGITRVWVNGRTVWVDGKTVRSRSGRALRREER
jgi:N-acyl-D-amino-acid deacylase